MRGMKSLDIPHISIETLVRYHAGDSDEAAERFVFSYTISIRNLGEVPAKLLRRHWVITDSDLQVQEVKGDGVIGEQPVLEPGQNFEYTSGTLLKTSVGIMRGAYTFETVNGFEFEVEIPQFVLSVPRVLH